MKLHDLLDRQWNAYSKTHRSRLNLIVHLIAVPLFIAGAIALVISGVRMSLVGAAGSVMVMLLAFAAQGIGHAREEFPAEPFKSPQQAAARIFLEQFVTFPRFFASGAWYRAFKSSRAKS